MSTGYQNAFAATIKGFRAMNGTTFTVTGSTVALSCTTAAAEADDLDFIPDGARNAAEPDNRVFAFNPSEAQAIVTEGTQGAWSGNGAVYVITRAYATGLGGTWRCIAYRVPKLGTSTYDEGQRAIWNK